MMPPEEVTTGNPEARAVIVKALRTTLDVAKRSVADHRALEELYAYDFAVVEAMALRIERLDVAAPLPGNLS